MTEEKHTPEPWSHELPRIAGDIGEFRPDGRVFASCHEPQAKGNARRIVACVNACARIPTEALEGGVIGELIAATEDFTNAVYVGLPTSIITKAGMRQDAALAKLTEEPRKDAASEAPTAKEG